MNPDKLASLWIDTLQLPERAWPAVSLYVETLCSANLRVNFFSRKMEIHKLWDEHVLDCALALPHFKSARGIVDLGTGGGFPGILLALCRPDCPVLLIDKSTKKLHYLDKIIAQLPAENIVLSPDLVSVDTEVYDTLTTRAVGSLSRIQEILNPYGLGGRLRQLHYKGRLERISEEILELRQNFPNLKASIHRLNMPHVEIERHLVEIPADSPQA